MLEGIKSMHELTFEEKQLDTSAEEVAHQVPGASFVMHVTIHTDMTIGNPSISVYCDGMIEKAFSSLGGAAGAPFTQAHKGMVFTFTYNKPFLANTARAVTIYSKTRIHVLRVAAISV
jgi:hypothetical protein